MLKRVEALEKKQQPTADDLKREIVQYALRQATDFDKYQALEKAEHLKFFARESKDKRADYYATVHSALLERINRPTDQFKSYVLALLGDREYEKIVEAIGKVDKSFQPRRDSNYNPFAAYPRPQFTPAAPPSPLMSQPYPAAYRFHRERRRYCSFCRSTTHSFSRCYRRQNSTGFGPAPRFRANHNNGQNFPSQ